MDVHAGQGEMKSLVKLISTFSASVYAGVPSTSKEETSRGAKNLFYGHAEQSSIREFDGHQPCWQL